jgi:hypothetical protein
MIIACSRAALITPSGLRPQNLVAQFRAGVAEIDEVEIEWDGAVVRMGTSPRAHDPNSQNAASLSPRATSSILRRFSIARSRTGFMPCAMLMFVIASEAKQSRCVEIASSLRSSQ